MLTSHNIKQKIKAYLRNDSGLAYIEFAFSVVILLILFYGGIEVSRYILIIQKVEKTSMMIANITSQYTGPADPTTTELSQLYNVVPYLLSPYNSTANEYVIISDVSVAASGPTTPILNWQSCGGGTYAQASHIGSGNGSAAILPSGFTMNPGEEVIFSEVFFQYTPILTQDIMIPTQLYRFAGFMPRNGSFQTLTYTCP